MEQIEDSPPPKVQEEVNVEQKEDTKQDEPTTPTTQDDVIQQQTDPNNNEHHEPKPVTEEKSTQNKTETIIHVDESPPIGMNILQSTSLIVSSPIASATSQKKEDKSKYPTSGFQSIKGRRQTMEDTHVIMDDVKAELKDHFPVEGEKHSFYGVYDGHGGKDAAEHVERLLHKNILEDPEYHKGNIPVAIKNGYLATDKEVLSIAVKEAWGSGTTCVNAIVVNNKLYVGNVGDSEAVMGRRRITAFESILLSQKQKPSDPSEKERIKAAGGHVVFGRVMGSLAVSRAIGDKDFKHPFCKGESDFVSAEPFVATYDLRSQDEFMIIACDGLWDKFTYQQAVDFVADCRDAGKTPQESAEAIVQAAFDQGSLDNITAIVVYLSNHVKVIRPIKKKQSGEDEEEDEVDAYEYLLKEGEKRKALAMQQAQLGSPKAKELFKHLELPNDEKLLDEYACGLEQTILYNGVMVLTPNFLNFYSSSFGKRVQKSVNLRDIETIRKHKSMIFMYAITIETQDRKKFVFNWGRHSTSRDEAFKRILELIEEQTKRVANPPSSAPIKTEPQTPPAPRSRDKPKRSTSTGALASNPLRTRRTLNTALAQAANSNPPTSENNSSSSEKPETSEIELQQANPDEKKNETATTEATAEASSEKKEDESTPPAESTPSPDDHTADVATKSSTTSTPSNDVTIHSAQPLPEDDPVPQPQVVEETPVIKKEEEVEVVDQTPKEEVAPSTPTESKQEEQKEAEQETEQHQEVKEEVDEQKNSGPEDV